MERKGEGFIKKSFEKNKSKEIKRLCKRMQKKGYLKSLKGSSKRSIESNRYCMKKQREETANW